MNNELIRNFNRKITTTNRYVTDSNSYWREELHARIADLPNITDVVKDIVNEKIDNNIWGFPADEQSINNSKEILNNITTDYFNFVKGRRVWVYTETDGYWTENNITDTISQSFVMALWDIGRNLLITNYPLIADDLKLRSGKTQTNDKKETYHDSLNKLNSNDKKYTQHDNTRNKTMEQRIGTGSDTTDGRTTSNTTNIQDNFMSPQDRGVLPSKQSDDLMNRVNDFQNPVNMGVEELKPNGNPDYTTSTINSFEGDTSTTKEGRTSTSNDTHNKIDEIEYNQGNETTETLIQSDDNVGSKIGNDTGVERLETLDISNVLKSFYDIFKDELILQIDNRMYPYYLTMKIDRFVDHRIGRNNYV